MEQKTITTYIKKVLPLITLDHRIDAYCTITRYNAYVLVTVSKATFMFLQSSGCRQGGGVPIDTWKISNHGGVALVQNPSPRIAMPGILTSWSQFWKWESKLGSSVYLCNLSNNKNINNWPWGRNTCFWTSSGWQGKCGGVGWRPEGVCWICSTFPSHLI